MEFWARGGGEGGVLPIMDYTGRIGPKGVPFLEVYKRIGTSRVEV